MENAIAWKDLGMILIGIGLIGLIILIGYGISFMRNLIITVKHTNKILEDTKIISGVAADKAQEVDRIIDDVTASVGSMANIIKGNQSTVSALTAIVNSIGSLKNLLKK